VSERQQKILFIKTLLKKTLKSVGIRVDQPLFCCI
jgi:hypothetical protein